MAIEAFGGSVDGHKIEVLWCDVQSHNQGKVSGMTDLLENQ